MMLLEERNGRRLGTEKTNIMAQPATFSSDFKTPEGQTQRNEMLTIVNPTIFPVLCEIM